MDVSSHISLAVFPAERRKSSLLLNPLFSLIIQKSVSAHFTTVQNAFNPLLSVALVAIIGHFRCLYWLIKYYHWPNYAASLHLGEILGWDLLQRPLPASLPHQGNNFEPPLKMPPAPPAPTTSVLLLLRAVLPFTQYLLVNQDNAGSKSVFFPLSSAGLCHPLLSRSDFAARCN